MRVILRATVIALFAVMLAHAAAAETYPTRPIRLILPYNPGGIVDSVVSGTVLVVMALPEFIIAVLVVFKERPQTFPRGPCVSA